MKKQEIPSASEIVAKTEFNTSEYNKLVGAILRNVKNRKYNFWYPFEVSDTIRKELATKGYVVEKSEYDWRDGGWLTEVKIPLHPGQ